MSSLLINGIGEPLPLPESASLEELLLHLRKQLVTESSLISSVKLDGEEIIGDHQNRYHQNSLSQFQQIEVFTIHPREIVDQTLTDMKDFVGYLHQLSLNTSAAILTSAFPGQFSKLVEGIGTFAEAVKGVKSLLVNGYTQIAVELEKDLYSILNHLLIEYQNHNLEAMKAILEDRIPANLLTWQNQAIPSLIHSKDC